MVQSTIRSATAGTGKTFLALFAVLSLLISALAMAAPAAATHDGGFDHQPLPIDTSTFAQDAGECEDVELEAGQVLLHWIANQQNATESIELILHLQGGGSVVLDSHKWNTPGTINSNVTHHFEVVLDGDVVITDLELSTNEGNVRLSHVCRAAGEGVADDAGILIQKEDENGARLAGAVFTVEGVSGEFTTGANGRVCVDGLPQGATLLVTEIQAPPGYRLADPASQLVEVDEDGCDSSPEAVFVNVLDDDAQLGVLEIDKILCPGDDDPLFQVIATGVPPTQFGIQSMHDECTTMDATFIVTPVGADEPWDEVTTEGGSVTFELPAGDYILTEKETGAMSGTVTVVEGALTIVLVTNFEGEGEQPGETANLKVVKWFCDGEEAGVRFEVLGGDVSIPNPANCELGNATFALNDPDSETTFTTSGGVLWLTGLPLGTHTLYEVAPNEASVEFTLTTAGGWVTIFAFNIAAEGEEGQQPGNGGQQPTEGQLPGGPQVGEGTLPDTAMPVTGVVPAALLALVMLTSLGAAGYAMQAEARRRR